MSCKSILTENILPFCTDTDGRMYFTATEDGRGLRKRRYYFSETFAAIGCAEYYKATGDDSIRESAERYFDVAYECYTGERKCEPKINLGHSMEATMDEYERDGGELLRDRNREVNDAVIYY